MTEAVDGRTTVLLVADELTRAGLRAIIDAEPDLVVVGEAGAGAEVRPLVRRHRPDVVLIDVPAVDGVLASRHLMVTTFENDALRAGANGFLIERSRREDIVRAIRMVVSGESPLFPTAIRALAAAHVNGLSRAGLTDREAEVLRLMTTGLSNVEIGERLFVSVQTVKTHVGNVLAKLGARDRTQAVILAYETGFVTPG
jgi:DNA-binding NarL/FixJ family response regulator